MSVLKLVRKSHERLGNEPNFTLVALLSFRPIEDEKIRRDYVEPDPIFPFWDKAWREETQPIEIELPSAISYEQKTVELTFDYGEHDQTLLKELGKAGLRQERIRRLLADAAYRRVTISNAVIGELLQVNVRTIERDRQKLKQSG